MVATAASRQSQVSEALEHLGHVVNELEGEVGEVEERFSTVLRPTNPMPGEGKTLKEAEERVRLAGAIQEMTDRVVRQVRRLREIRDRAEL